MHSGILEISGLYYKSNKKVHSFDDKAVVAKATGSFCFYGCDPTSAKASKKMIKIAFVYLVPLLEVYSSLSNLIS